MQKRIVSWRLAGLHKPLPGSPEPRLYRFVPKFALVDIQSASKEGFEDSSSVVKADSSWVSKFIQRLIVHFVIIFHIARDRLCFVTYDNDN